MELILKEIISYDTSQTLASFDPQIQSMHTQLTTYDITQI